jgi:transglutaminase-like putative cysteine protease
MKISLKYKGATQLAWIDEAGEILKEQGMLGVTREKTTREDAMRDLSVQPSQDLTKIASIPSNIMISNPETLTRLVAEIAGVDDQALHLHGGRQIYQAPLLTIEKENLYAVGGPAAADRLSSEQTDFLKPAPFVQSDHPAIRKLAGDITSKTDNGLEKARKIVSWMQNHIKKRPVLSLPDALSTLENRVGDCNEHAVLFAALARASGIPTKIEAGVVYLKDRFYYHAWNSVYIGEWITLDALFDQIPADVTHIRLTSGTQEDQMNILGLIGVIRIHILDGTH